MEEVGANYIGADFFTTPATLSYLDGHYKATGHTARSKEEQSVH